jgi:DNA-binding IscR family transcriptional regulator
VLRSRNRRDPRAGGKRATEALTHITRQPGITIPELASKMGINQSYLYKVLPTLEQTGSVTKQGRGWHPKGK